MNWRDAWSQRVAITARLRRAQFRRGVRARKMAGLELVGGRHTGWVIPTTHITPDWTCYTAGVGEDTSFDVALAERGCRVVALDPTPRAARHIEPVVARYPNIQFVPYAVWTSDTELAFYEPRDRSHVSHSIHGLQGTHRSITVPARSLSSLALELGDERVDLVKMDIEGAEFEVVAETDFHSLGTRVVCIEYHDRGGLNGMLAAVRSLEREGFTPVSTRYTDVTFVRDDLLP